MSIRIPLALCLAAGLTLPAGAGEQIFTWTDERGVAHYTDDRELVPEPFRDSMRVVEKSEVLQHVIERRPAARPPRASDEAAALLEAHWRERAAALDSQIASLEPVVERCAGDHYNVSPGDGSRRRREERAEAEACARAREQLAQAREAREALTEEARREGIPPGWVRGE
jgi:hypothetical protein